MDDLKTAYISIFEDVEDVKRMIAQGEADARESLKDYVAWMKEQKAI